MNCWKPVPGGSASRMLAPGAMVPERIGENGPRGATLIAELGVDPPA